MFPTMTTPPTTPPTAEPTPLTGSLLGDLTESAGGPTFGVHFLGPRQLGSPLHTHHDQDEWSFVLSGLVGVRVGSVTVTARAGEVVLKPRGVPHAFWNAGGAPARFLEVITADGFSDYFPAMDRVLTAAGPTEAATAEVSRRFGVVVDPASVPALLEEHGLVLP